MQIVSEADLALIQKHSKVSLFAYVDGTRIDADVCSAEYTPSCGDDTAFSFGNACAARINFTLSASMPHLKGHGISVKWAVSETEYPLFEGRAERARVSAGRTNVEAWDEMYYSGSELYQAPDTGAGSVSAALVFAEIAGAMGVDVDAVSRELLSDIVIDGGLGSLSGQITNSAVAGYIAALVGGNALITRSGKLAVRLFTAIDWETEPYEGGAEADNEEYAVTGIAFLKEALTTIDNEDGTSSEESSVETFSAGDGSLMVSNPLGNQIAAERAFEALESLRFRPGNYTFPGYILLEPGDMFRVLSIDGTYNVAAVNLAMSIDGGVKTTVSAGGALDEGGISGTVNQALRALEADLAKLRHLVAENATIVSAKITNLSVEDLKTGKIRSLDFMVDELEEIYPAADLFPDDSLYPNNGEEIVRGLEIDFTTGVIRGVFFNSVTDALTERVEVLEKQNAKILELLSALEEKLT